MAVGTVSGALLAAGRDRPQFLSLLIGAAIFGLGCTLAAIAPDYWLFAGALVVIGVAALTFTNASNSMMQLSTEPAMRGRVMSLNAIAFLGSTPIGAPLLGWISDATNPRVSLVVGGVATLLASIPLFFLATRQRAARGSDVMLVADEDSNVVALRPETLEHEDTRHRRTM